ncbi:MAG: hypothetical protein LUD72_07425 [Bacteroidales bacterium]|nr:hypothetical protein [Bacteroidales bacterium]
MTHKGELTLTEYLALTEEERKKLISQYRHLCGCLPPAEKQLRARKRKKKAMKHKEAVKKRQERQKIKAQEERERQKLAEAKKREKEKEKEKKEKEKQREKERHEKEKAKLSAARKRRRDKKRNTYKRHKRAEISIPKRKEKEAKKERLRKFRANKPFMDEKRWLDFCNKSEEEREAILARRRKNHRKLPKEYQLRWVIAEYRRLRLQKREAHKRKVKSDRKKRWRLYYQHKKYGDFETTEEKNRIRMRQTRQRYHARLRAEFLAQKASEGDELGNYAIYIYRNRRARKVVASKAWRNDILGIYEEELKKHSQKVYVPDMRGDATYEMMLVRDARPDESGESYLRVEGGKFVKHVLVGKENKVILRKDKWHDEENFYVYGFHPSEERKDFQFVYDELLYRAMEDGHTTKTVMVHKRKVVIKGNGDFDLVIARNNEVAATLYDALLEKYGEDKGNGIFFLGTMGDVTWQKFLPEMMEKTGWTEEECRLTEF